MGWSFSFSNHEGEVHKYSNISRRKKSTVLKNHSKAKKDVNLKKALALLVGIGGPWKPKESFSIVGRVKAQF